MPFNIQMIKSALQILGNRVDKNDDKNSQATMNKKIYMNNNKRSIKNYLKANLKRCVFYMFLKSAK